MNIQAESLRLVCLSDTHSFHRHIAVPHGDVLIHAGDLTSFYNPLEKSLEVLRDFVPGWVNCRTGTRSSSPVTTISSSRKK